MNKRKISIIVAWATGFSLGVVGEIMGSRLLYYLGFFVAVIAVIIMVRTYGGKKLWDYIVNLLTMAP